MSETTCVLDGCDRPSRSAARMCAMHQGRQVRHGDPTYTPRQRVIDAAIERFWRQVDKSSECWIWTGSRTANGYGYFRVKLDEFPGSGAHRFAWRITKGSIPAGMQLDHVCHSNDERCPGGPACQHRACVNPAHLEPVTPRENTLRGKSISGINAQKPVCPKCGSEYAVAKRGARKPGRWCPPCHSERRRQRKAERRRKAAEAGKPCSPACPMLACDACRFQNGEGR